MVKISITPKRGNNTRFFPHHGYLGLSPVIISGTVSTRLEKDAQSLEASKVVIRIRCYEGLGAHPGQGAGLGSDLTHHHDFKPPKINVLWETEKTLWTPSTTNNDDHDKDEGYGFLGDTDTHWKLVIPVSATQRSLGGQAVGSMTYRTWKAWWQVEAVILHKPAGIHGSTIVKTHPMFLPNHSRPIPINHQQNQNILKSSCSKFSYSITAPSIISCGDLTKVSISLYPLNSITEPIVIKNISVGLQRTLSIELDNELEDNLNDEDNVIDNPSNSLGSGLPSSSKRWKLRHLQTRSRSTPTPSKLSSRFNSKASSASPTTTRHTSAISTITTLVETDSLQFYESSTLSSLTGLVHNRILHLQIPKAKSRYHYSIGDSCQTKWAVVSYSLVVKVMIKSKSSGLETISLNGLPVELMSVPNSELKLALQSIKPQPTTINSNPLNSIVPFNHHLDSPNELHHRLSSPPVNLNHHQNSNLLKLHQRDLDGSRFLVEPGLGRPMRLSAPPCNT